MRRSVRPFAVLFLLVASTALASCSKSSTIMALTINTPTKVNGEAVLVDVFNVKVVSPSNGAPLTAPYSIDGTKLTVGGAIDDSFFDRHEMDSAGLAVVSVEALRGSTVVASGATDTANPVEIYEHEVTAITVNLKPPASPSTGTGGMSGTGGSGAGGAAGGAPGATGGSGGSVAGAGGRAAGGAGGRAGAGG